MRVTLNIDADLLRRAKKRAAEKHGTLAQVVEAALRLVLLERPRTVARQRTRLVTYRGKGLLPGVSIESNAALLQAMEEEWRPFA